MLAAKEIIKRKSHKTTLLSTAEGGKEHNENKEYPHRVFLYLQLQSISYPSEDTPAGRVEIELEHEIHAITAFSDHYMPRNIIYGNQFDIEKPTFSVTIEQDNIEDITSFSNAPIFLTLYVITSKRPEDSVSKTKGLMEKKEKVEEIFIEERIAVAQGFIDIMEYFKRTRSRSSETVYLYPLETSANALTCKTEWEIYSLHPLLKNIVFSNVLFITLGSLYNIDESLMADCDDLVTKLSFISKTPNENNKYEQVLICKFTAFSKCIISEQNLSKKWENLKNRKLNNSNSMGIMTDSKFSLNKLFNNILCTESVEFHFENINITEDYALICNSMHRYILTDVMQKSLEEILSCNHQQIIMEIFSERDENKILLEGFIDLSIFMYPEIRYCSYAIELRPPTLPISKETAKSTKGKKKSKKSFDVGKNILTEIKKPFAVLQICLNKPITNPTHDITEFSIHESKLDKYAQCSMTQYSKAAKITLELIRAKKYRDFDDLVSEILDYTIRNNIKSVDDDKEFFCLQLGNMTNKIMKLVACDFNVRFSTNTNIEFTNLMTTVYGELTERISESIQKCSRNVSEICFVNTVKDQTDITYFINMAKYMYECENLEMANFFMEEILNKYPNNSILKFYLFLYDMERQNFQLAKEYLEKSPDYKDIEGQSYTHLIQIYLNYKLEIQNSKQIDTAEENLLKALTEYCTYFCPKSLSGWILLYCLYKKHNYQPGMSFTRWKYENLCEHIFVEPEIFPQSRWEIYTPYKIELKSVKGHNYVKVMEKLLRLGLYEFAEWVFEEIANECLEIEKYFMFSTFNIFINNFHTKFAIKDFAMEKLPNPLHMNATLSQVNGSLEYFRNPLSDKWMKYYKAIISIEDLDIYDNYQLGILRFAFRMIKKEQYKEAIEAFELCCDDKWNRIAALIGRGTACYHVSIKDDIERGQLKLLGKSHRYIIYITFITISGVLREIFATNHIPFLQLEQLEEAEKYFALSTKYGLYIPNTWAYLALINLKRGNNFNALECWKYAKLSPENEIHEEILAELSKINISDVSLYVDIPNES